MSIADLHFSALEWNKTFIGNRTEVKMAIEKVSFRQKSIAEMTIDFQKEILKVYAFAKEVFEILLLGFLILVFIGLITRGTDKLDWLWEVLLGTLTTFIGVTAAFKIERWKNSLDRVEKVAELSGILRSEIVRVITETERLKKGSRLDAEIDVPFLRSTLSSQIDLLEGFRIEIGNLVILKVERLKNEIKETSKRKIGGQQGLWKKEIEQALDELYELACAWENELAAKTKIDIRGRELMVGSTKQFIEARDAHLKKAGWRPDGIRVLSEKERYENLTIPVNLNESNASKFLPRWPFRDLD